MVDRRSEVLQAVSYTHLAENSYHIDAHTTQGDIVAPRGADDAARTIGVTSSLGDIQINFTSK